MLAYGNCPRGSFFMTWNWFDELLGSYIKKLTLWIKDESGRFVFFVLALLILSFIIIPKFLAFLSVIDYPQVAVSSYEFIYKNSNSRGYGLILLGAILILILFMLFLHKKVMKGTIYVNPEKEPELWSFYKGSGWYIVDDIESWNKVLKITNSFYPAVLKFGHEWINYNLYFQVKVPSNVPVGSRNFSVVVRARDKSNNVFLQCNPDGKITPHVIADGIFIVDDKNPIDFLAQYPLDKWFDVSVSVQGDKAVIRNMGLSATYKIPSERFVISAGMTNSVMTLSYVIEKNIKRENSIESTSQGSSGIPVFVLNLDYENGTIGFRESGQEAALFRKIRIELKHPFHN